MEPEDPSGSSAFDGIFEGISRELLVGLLSGSLQQRSVLLVVLRERSVETKVTLICTKGFDRIEFTVGKSTSRVVRC